MEWRSVFCCTVSIIAIVTINRYIDAQEDLAINGGTVSVLCQLLASTCARTQGEHKDLLDAMQFN
jgi:hypothetical protein